MRMSCQQAKFNPFNVCLADMFYICWVLHTERTWGQPGWEMWVGLMLTKRQKSSVLWAVELSWSYRSMLVLQESVVVVTWAHVPWPGGMRSLRSREWAGGKAYWAGKGKQKVRDDYWQYQEGLPSRSPLGAIASGFTSSGWGKFALSI